MIFKTGDTVKNTFSKYHQKHFSDDPDQFSKFHDTTLEQFPSPLAQSISNCLLIRASHKARQGWISVRENLLTVTARTRKKVSLVSTQTRYPILTFYHHSQRNYSRFTRDDFLLIFLVYLIIIFLLILSPGKSHCCSLKCIALDGIRFILSMAIQN